MITVKLLILPAAIFLRGQSLWVSWSGAKSVATPGRSSRIRHRNQSTPERKEQELGRRGSRGGEMGEFSPPPPFSEPLISFFFFLFHRKSIMLMHRPQTPQPGFGSITLLQTLTPPPPHFKILDPRLLGNFLSKNTTQ